MMKNLYILFLLILTSSSLKSQVFQATLATNGNDLLIRVMPDANITTDLSQVEFFIQTTETTIPFTANLVSSGADFAGNIPLSLVNDNISGGVRTLRYGYSSTPSGSSQTYNAGQEYELATIKLNDGGVNMADFQLVADMTNFSTYLNITSGGGVDLTNSNNIFGGGSQSLFYGSGSTGSGAGIHTSGLISASLPITVSQFTAEKINERSARLFWETTSEINSDYFIIQRSTDTENWESLGKVDAIGTPTSTQSYEFIDNTIPTTLRSEDNIFFYRLAMVDLDEQYELSEIRTLSFKGTSGIINIYPNPTAQNLIVDLSSVEGNSKIQLIDIQGRLIFEQKVTDEYNDIPVLNLRDMGLDNGTYLIRITEDSNRKVHTKKFLFID